MTRYSNLLLSGRSKVLEIT